MDNITLIGLIGSIVSIVSLFISIFSSSSKTNIFSNNRTSINQTLNVNSNNSVTNNYDFRSYKGSSTSRTSTSSSNDPIAMIALGVLVAAIVIPNYLVYQDKVIFWVLIFGIAGLIINLATLFIINRKINLDKLYLCSNTIKWFPLFLMLIFIYHPLYSSSTLSNTKQLLIAQKNFFEILQKYGYDVFYFAMQITGIIFVTFLISLHTYKSLKQLYKTLKYNYEPSTGNWKDFLWHVLALLFAFILVSGLYAKFFIYFNKITSIR